jgi:hypothetical protein
VTFFPTAICEDECGAPGFPGGSTNAKGEGTLRVRVPGTFLDAHERHVYFRDRERIDVEVIWEGADETVAVGSAEPDPVIVRDQGRRRAMAALTADRTSGSPGASPKNQLPVPNGFRVQGTNGYTLSVIGEGPRGKSSGSLHLAAVARGQEVTYEAPATVTETSMHADLGALGEISVEFQRSGQAASVPCGKQDVRFDSGSWAGTIRFHGEEGYTDVEATSAPTDVKYLLGPFCGRLVGESSLGGQGKGAELDVRNPGLGPQMSVYKPRPGSAALISAYLSEYDEGISIHRRTVARMPGRDFSYAPNLRAATVAPPGPFAGTARFELGEKAGRRWSGDLTVDMPGRDDVPLTGPLLRATLRPSE